MKHKFYTKPEDETIQMYELSNSDFAFFICAMLIGVVIGGFGTLAYLSYHSF